MPEKRSGFNSLSFQRQWRESAVEGVPVPGFGPTEKGRECPHGPQVLSTRSGGLPGFGDEHRNPGDGPGQTRPPSPGPAGKHAPLCGRHGRRIENAPVYKRTSGKSGER